MKLKITMTSKNREKITKMIDIDDAYVLSEILKPRYKGKVYKQFKEELEGGYIIEIKDIDIK